MSAVADNDFPPPPDTDEFRALGENVRDWRPEYRVGDAVRRIGMLGSDPLGYVQEFSWRGNHLMVTIRFATGREEMFAASGYMLVFKRWS